jgi:hypothetical protein
MKPKRLNIDAVAALAKTIEERAVAAKPGTAARRDLMLAAHAVHRLGDLLAIIENKAFAPWPDFK